MVEVATRLVALRKVAAVAAWELLVRWVAAAASEEGALAAVVQVAEERAVEEVEALAVVGTGGRRGR